MTRQRQKFGGFEIENLTQGTVTIVLGEEFFDYYPTGQTPRVHVDRVSVGAIEIGEGFEIPLSRTTAGETYGLPDQEPGTFRIVSAIVARENVDRGDLLIVDRTVRDGTGRVSGAASLATVANPEAFDRFVRDSAQAIDGVIT